MQRYLSRRYVTIPNAARGGSSSGGEQRVQGKAPRRSGEYGRSHLACTALIPSYLSATRCATLARADYIKWLVKRSA